MELYCHALCLTEAGSCTPQFLPELVPWFIERPSADSLIKEIYAKGHRCSTRNAYHATVVLMRGAGAI
jgi:hypothetical protein